MDVKTLIKQSLDRSERGWLPNQDLTELEKLVIKNDLIIPVSYKELKQFTQEQISMFCHVHAIYQFPTTELIEFLKQEIPDLESSIEIGAGNGHIGRNVGIKMFDSKLQDEPLMKVHYGSLKIPTIKYGKDIIKMDGIAAVMAYKPKTVLGCWITGKIPGGVSISDIEGIDEVRMFKHGVTKYVHVGNLNTHRLKPTILEFLGAKLNFKQIQAPWLITRSMSYKQNIIQIFTKK